MTQITSAPFPAEVVVSAPASVHVPGDCLVFVRCCVPDQVSVARQRYGSRVAGWEVEASGLASVELWELLIGSPVRARLGGLDTLQDPDVMQCLQETRPLCTLVPGPDLDREVTLLAGLGIPVHIDTATPIDFPEALCGVGDHYLHSPTLATPIQPMHGLLQAISTGSGATLWELESEECDLHAFLTEDGLVTLSRRWAEAGQVYGSARETWEQLTRSALYRRLESLPVEGQQGEGPCTTCEYFQYCKGFLRAVRASAPCDAWKAVFGLLVQAVKEARRILGEEQDRPAG